MEKENICLKNDKYFWKPDTWAVNIALLIFAIPVAYKVAVTPFSLNIDLNALLSILLALFSVGLSAMFYFKANETSNSFYDNTYKFTKDIAELLVRIESGFGERLRHIDEGYTSMRDYIQTSSTRPKANVEVTKQKIESEEQEIVKVVEERNKIIQELVEKSQLQEEEKQKFTTLLEAKELELSEVQKDLEKLKSRLTLEKASRRIRRIENHDLDSSFANFTYQNVIRKIGTQDTIHLSPVGIRRRFRHLKDDLPRGYLADLDARGFYDDDLTDDGVNFLKNVAQHNSPSNPES